MGVWIEIKPVDPLDEDEAASPPMWGCGLKYLRPDLAESLRRKSPPMWGCGLKFDWKPDMVIADGHPLCGGVD